MRKRYVKTHGSYDAGEMVERDYNWPLDPTSEHGAKVDPKTFAFGVRDQAIGGTQDGVKSALYMDRDATLNYPKTRIVPLTAETYREVNCDPLGRAKNNMQGVQKCNYTASGKLPPNHAYGIKCIGSDSTVGDCLRGWYDESEQNADYDLGKSQKVGRRNDCETGRAYGTPSIRADIAKPATRSCADMQNYGDEAGASALLHPQRFELMGVPDEEFILRRDKEEIKSILECANIETTHFEVLFNTALQLFEDGKPLVSLDAYLFCCSNMINKHVAGVEGALSM